jgi:hypothetical protein
LPEDVPNIHVAVFQQVSKAFRECKAELSHRLVDNCGQTKVEEGKVRYFAKV